MDKLAKANTGDAAVRKALSLFLALAADGEAQPLSALAKARGIAPSTAYRLIQPFLDAGLLAKPKRQCYLPGLTMFNLARGSDELRLLAMTARQTLQRSARAVKGTAHLGVWADDMVTYLVKESGGTDDVFTKEGMQLEAYCSAIGKVLLAHMPDSAKDAYLANGPFVALTSKTITDPATMRTQWQQVKAQGYGEDVEEISERLRCISVPIRGPRGSVIAAISISSTTAPHSSAARLTVLHAAARDIETALAGADPLGDRS